MDNTFEWEQPLIESVALPEFAAMRDHNGLAPTGPNAHGRWP
jgi:hypothetical protein